MRQEIKSPCNSVCRIDEASSLCAGCLRTLDEIAAWPAMDDAMKLALRIELSRRRVLLRRQRAPPEVDA